MKTTRLRVTLRHVEPAVARVIDAPATATLPELNDLLQVALGWTNSHLHQFVTPEATYGMALTDVEPLSDDERDEADAKLADLGAKFEYHYDFGDGWMHDVEVLGPGNATPGCVDGHGSCPPEDCGGPGGYAELLDALADPAHPEHESLSTWVGNRLRPFDQAHADQRVRRVVGEPPESVRLLVDSVGDGVKLTPGGRLPRSVVRAIQQHRPGWDPFDRPAHTEDDLWPLVELHALLRRVGVLRLRNGVLAPTRAAADDLAVVRRLRSAFAPDTFDTEIIELTVGVLAAHGPLPPARIATHVLKLLNHRWRLGGQPLTTEDVRRAVAGQSALMTGLDLIDQADWDGWALGASARSLLPGAEMLAEVWGHTR